MQFVSITFMIIGRGNIGMCAWRYCKAQHKPQLKRCLVGVDQTTHEICHSCWMESRIKEVAPDRAGISRLIDLVKAIADSDVTLEEHE